MNSLVSAAAVLRPRRSAVSPAWAGFAGEASGFAEGTVAALPRRPFSHRPRNNCIATSHFEQNLINSYRGTDRQEAILEQRGAIRPRARKPQRVDAEEEESRRAQVTKIATLVIVGFITVLTVGLVHTVLSGQTSLSGDRPKPKASPSSRAQTSVLDRIRGAFPFTGSFGGLNDDDGNIAHPHLGGYLWLSSNARGGSSTPSVSFVNLAADQPEAACSTPAALVDGVTFGIQGKCNTIVTLSPSKGSSVSVQLSDEVPTDGIGAIEIWEALPECSTFFADKKKMKQCQGDLHPLTPQEQLLAELLDADGRTIAQQAFSQRRSVYRWAKPLATGSAAQLRISLKAAGGKEAAAAGAAGRFKVLLAEARVYGALPRPAQCHPRVCGAHGRCHQAQGGAAECICHPDWFGPNCDYDILTANTYLPWPEADGGASWGPPSQWEAAMDFAQGEDLNCSLAVERARHHELLPGPRGAGAGLASSLIYMLGDHTTALMAGAPYVFTGKINYAENGYCDELKLPGAMECYFEPLLPGGCPADEYKRQQRAFHHPQANPPGEPDCKLGTKCLDVSDLYAVPPAFKQRGIFWWRAVQTAHVTRINAGTAALLDLAAVKRQIGYEHPIIGLHIRHGDACFTTRRAGRCAGLDRYIPELTALKEAYGVSRVFVASDDPEVIKATKQFPQFKWVFAQQDREAYGVRNAQQKIEHRLRDGLDSHRLMLDALADTAFLAEADYLVVSLSSTMSRMALLLSAARQRRLPPFVSIDAPFCPHWRMCCDLDETGSSTVC